MARPSKLTVEQCGKAIDMRRENPDRWTVPKLAKHFHVSESSMYKVFDGSYVARPIAPKPQRLSVVQPHKPKSEAMPSLFHRRASDIPGSMLRDIDLSKLPEPTDQELVAARMILAKSKFCRALRAA